MIQFANPIYLLLLLLIPVLIVLFIGGNIKKKKDVEKMGNLRTIKSLMPDFSLKRSYLRFWITIVIIAFCIIMIARPQFGTKVDRVDKEGIELVIAIDVSNSMLAQDIKPNRLEKAKQIINRIISERKSDKIALIVFAGDAYVQMPLTADGQSAKLFLENMNPSLVSVQGTDIASALELSMRSFSGEEDVDRAIVLITDGENHDGNGVEMAKQALSKGIQVNVIGIGSKEGSPIIEPNGEFKKDSQGNVVISRLNEEISKEIASAGKGLYAHADNSNRALKSLQSELEKLQTKKIEGVIYSDYDEKFYIPAWIILVLLIFEICIFEKKNRLFRNIRIFK